MICKKTSVIILTFFNWNVKMKGLIKDKENLKKKNWHFVETFFHYYYFSIYTNL